MVSSSIKTIFCILLFFSVAFAFDWTPANQIPDGYSVIRFSRTLTDIESNPSPLGAKSNTKQWAYSGYIEIIGKFVPFQISTYNTDYTLGKFRLKNATVRWYIDNTYSDTAITSYSNKPDKVCTGSQHFYSSGEQPLDELKYYYDDYDAQALVDFDSGNWQAIERYESDKHPLLDLELRKSNYEHPNNFYEFLPWFYDGNFLIPVRSAPSAVGDCGSIPFSTVSKITFFKYQIPVVGDTTETNPVHLTGSGNYYSLGFKPYDNSGAFDLVAPVEVNPDQVLSPSEDQPSWEISWDIKLTYLPPTNPPSNNNSNNPDNNNSNITYNCDGYCTYDDDCCAGYICDGYGQCVQTPPDSGSSCPVFFIPLMLVIYSSIRRQ
ncbi:MAG: hypothetical protein ABID61_05950 [Candidatus Micrarchaeota archaeon]